MSASKIADNIKKYRNRLGISQDKLSKLADVTYNTIIKIESRPTPTQSLRRYLKSLKP